ncbi:MAG: isoleucyl-tRNA synthetase [Anaerolineae bacterium SM23_ 63]|nr:MAG: isoleucyl-tRNA synthetase [Anaerolineae bacterium SM23_ 63]
MFKPVPSKTDFIALEHEILKFWEDTQAFEKLKELRVDGPIWSFIDGPITANNPMGIHHGWGRTYKDLYHRFKAMQGFQTRYQNGFDCQGLWVEVNVERDMGFKSKRDIEDYGLAKFVILCKQRVLKYAAIQTEQSIRLGYWMDWDDLQLLRLLHDEIEKDPAKLITVDGAEGPVRGTIEQIVGQLGMPELGGSYYTFSDENNYTIWGVLKSCHERGWVYKGTDVMPWCARCGTGLSQHEIVTEGYQEITHPSITLRFPLVDRPNESLLIWTTTPWTLTSNVAAAVGPDLEYVKVRQGEEILYLSRGTVHMLKGPYEVEAQLKGADMEGWKYEGPFDELPAQVRSGAVGKHCVILWDDVGEEEGTGIVHIAPGCGAEDFELSKEYELAVIAPLTEDGVFIHGFDWLTGMSVNDVAQPIFANLTEKGLTYKLEDYTHRYPVCWRCREELVFRLVDEWFISMGENLGKPYEEVTEEEKSQNLRYQIMEVVINETNWYPSFGLERELDWLRNMDDWMISKKRYWGLALPIWECSRCGHFEIFGSMQELHERAVAGWDSFDGHTPHRPFIDAVQIECSQCGEHVRRIPDVGNPWLDAGIVGMSTLRYNTDREYWKEWFPADWISESFPGQFRNWFYSLLTMSTILERRAPFKHVFTYGTLLAEDGREMHKSWGNAIEFNEAADKMGVDVMRWLYCDHKPEKDLLFGYHRADEVRRHFLLPLWNIYSFFVTYANIDGWVPDGTKPLTYSLLDRWILSRLNEAVAEVTLQLESYEPNIATTEVARFLDHLGNWYLRRSRRRFWAKAGASEASDADKHAAYTTLYHVLVVISRLLAPFVPFITEEMYQNLVRNLDPQVHESIHHCKWPEVDPKILDPELTEEMALVMRLVSLGHAARNKANRKLRQPLKEAAFVVGTVKEREIVDRYADLISDELNVKEVRLLDMAVEVVDYQLKPLPKQLGQKYGSRFPGLRDAILEVEPQTAAARLQMGESITVESDGESFHILPEEIEIRMDAHEGFSAASEGLYLAALVTELTPELELEGLAREFVRRAQELRKAADLEVDERIDLFYNATDRLSEAVIHHREYIVGETLALRLEEVDQPAGQISSKHTFDGEELEIALQRSAT